MDPHMLRGTGSRVPEPKKKNFSMYIRKNFALIMLVGVSLAVLVTLFVVKLHIVVDDPASLKRVVHVQRGMGVRAIGNLLAREGLIKRPWEFVAWVKIKGVAGQLKAGRFSIQSNYPIPVIINELVNGKALMQSVTIPEGLTMREIAGLLQREIALDSSTIHTLCTDAQFISTLDIFSTPASLEGFLFPETYNFDPDIDEQGFIKMMVRLFKRVYLEEYAMAAGAVTLPNYKLLILASIVEREAKLATERDLVAAVFHNRLKISQHLESCATVNYIRNDVLGLSTRPVLLNKDLKIVSPYNTYMYCGLPPGPICNPGRAALKATMLPADTDAIFFVSKGDGSHHFSRTLREHVNAKNKYKSFYKKKR